MVFTPSCRYQAANLQLQQGAAQLCVWCLLHLQACCGLRCALLLLRLAWWVPLHQCCSYSFCQQLALSCCGGTCCTYQVLVLRCA